MTDNIIKGVIGQFIFIGKEKEMVYKIGNVSDIDTIPLIDDTALELLLHYARVLTLIQTMAITFSMSHGAKIEEIKAYFAFTFDCYLPCKALVTTSIHGVCEIICRSYSRSLEIASEYSP